MTARSTLGQAGALALAATLAHADIVQTDDVIVQGSLCAGSDCLNGENFGYDTLRLKQSNTRIHFEDTSTIENYPRNDWRLVANDSVIGGDEFFAIENTTRGGQPFVVEADAPDRALVVSTVGNNSGRVTIEGIITAGLYFDLNNLGAPGNSWGIFSYLDELHFFETSPVSGNVPIIIASGAGYGALVVEKNGIGLGTTSPDGPLHVSADSAYLTLEDNNDNDKWWITHGAGNAGNLEFTSQLDGGTANVAMVIEPDGDVGLGTLAPDGPLHIADNSAFITLEDTDNNDAWYITHQAGDNGDFEFTSVLNGSLVNLAFSVQPDGDLIIDGALTQNSDKNAKMGVEPVDPEQILGKVTVLDLARWTYKDDTSGARHIGPMAQDFHALFGVGASETGISSLDTGGVALAAIQALAAQAAEAERRAGTLADSVQALNGQVATLSANVRALTRANSDQAALIEALLRSE